MYKYISFTASQLICLLHSPEDQATLEAEYKRNSKPDKAARMEILKKVSLGEKEVQVRNHSLYEGFRSTRCADAFIEGIIETRPLNNETTDMVPEPTSKYST